MKLNFFSLLAFFFLLLSDPDGSGSCGGCDSYLTETGTLPDTTLNVGDVWKIDIKKRLWYISSSCDGYSYSQNAPKIIVYQTNSILNVTQARDTLFIDANDTGKSGLTMVSGSSGSIDPTILTQTLTITVE